MKTAGNIFACVLVAALLCVLSALVEQERAQAQQPTQTDYLAVSVTATGTAAKLSTLIGAQMGWTAQQLDANWREVTIQVDPETCTTASVRIGQSTLGTTVNGVVQKGSTLACGWSLTVRNTTASQLLTSVWVQTITGSQVINVEAWK